MTVETAMQAVLGICLIALAAGIALALFAALMEFRR